MLPKDCLPRLPRARPAARLVLSVGAACLRQKRCLRFVFAPLMLRTLRGIDGEC